MTVAYYDLDASPALDAIERAVNFTADHPPAYQSLFSHKGLIGVDWDKAANCHHSNTSLVAAIGSMIDSKAAEAALYPNYRLATAVGGTSCLDENQKGAFLAAAGVYDTSRNPQWFTEAVNELIDTEELGDYFERGPEAARSHERIRPYGYTEYWSADGRPELLPMQMVKAKADKERLPKDKRVALLIVLALYNESDTKDTFKGRGWVFHGAELGRWLRERFASNERSARAALRAIGHYCYW